MRVLVTGGAGFIGSRFIRTLLRVLPDVEVGKTLQAVGGK
jgi:nucleoside-diphosphate-sugar epimerase